MCSKIVNITEIHNTGFYENNAQTIKYRTLQSVVKYIIFIYNVENGVILIAAQQFKAA